MSLYGESDGREPYRRVDEALRTIAKTLPARTPLFFMYGADDVDEDEDEDEDAKLSCAFFHHVSKLADSLRPIVNAENRFVAIVANPGDGYAAALCAVLLCGCAFIPVDREWSEVRQRRVLEHANPAAIVFVGPRPPLIGTARWKGRLIDAPEHVPRVTGAAATSTPTLPDPPPWAEDALYVVYTSGSTGEPKGVVGTHTGLLARARWAAEGPMRMNPSPPERDDGEESELEDAGDALERTRGCLHTRVGFVDSVTETLCPLLQGAPSVVPQKYDSSHITYAMLEEEVTHFSAVPSFWERLTNDWLAEINLTTAVCSGEPMPVPLMNRIIRNAGGVYEGFDRENIIKNFTLINLYGSTEVAGDATELQIKQRLIPSEVGVDSDQRRYEVVYRNKSSQLVPLDKSLAFAPAGFDLPFAQTIIVKREGEGADEKFSVVKEVGEVGEVVVRGLGVASGYRDAGGEIQGFGSGAMDELFKGDPMPYHLTGDLGRWDQKGLLHLEGRVDDIVKPFGERVNLNEISAAAMKLAYVTQAVARFWSINEISHADGTAGTGGAIAVYVVVNGNMHHPSVVHQSVVKSCRQQGIPRVAVPMEDAVMILAEMPLNANGKIDRSALPLPRALNFKGGTGKRKTMASSSDAGADILAEMQKILGSGSEWMKQSDDFFFAGGASPDVIVLAQTLGVPAEVVVRHRTAAAIAAAIAEPSAEVMPSSSGEIDVLPAEVLHRILAFVPLKEQLSVMRLVCKSWRKAVDDTPAPLIQDETEQQAPQGTLVRMWSAHLGRCVDAAPLLSNRYTVSKSRTYIGSHSQEVCCLDPDGQVVWKKELPGRIEAMIVFGKGVVGRSRRGDKGSQLIVPCLDGKVYCLDENTGEILWQYDTGGEVKCGLALTDCGSRLETSTSLDQRPRAVHVPGYRLLWGQSHGGSAFAIAASGPHAGKAIWRYENSGPGVVEPVVDDTYDTQQDVFFANLKGDVFVVEADAVTEDWMEHVPDVIKEAKEYVRWSTNVGAPVFSTPSVNFQGTTVQGMTFPIIVANVDGLVFGLDRDNGQKVWTVDLGCKIYAPIYSDIEEINNDFAAKVLIGTADGELVLLRRQQYGLPNPNLGEEKREVADDEFYMTEVWRWKGRGSLRAGPVFINTGRRQVDKTGIFVAAWDSGEISVFSYSDDKNDRLPRHLSTGRLPAPIFGTPAFAYDDHFSPSWSRRPPRPLSDMRIYVGCRDDRLHCLKVSDVRYGVKIDDGKPTDEMGDG